MTFIEIPFWSITTHEQEYGTKNCKLDNKNITTIVGLYWLIYNNWITLLDLYEDDFFPLCICLFT